MAKDLKGKELGKGLSQRKDKKYSARYVSKSGKRIEKYFDTLLSMVVEGKDDWEIINANPSYMLHLNRVRELRNLQREKEFKTKRRLDLEVHYVWGDSRSGKSCTIRDTYD